MRMVLPGLSLILMFSPLVYAAGEPVEPMSVYIDPQRVIDEAVAIAGTRNNAEALVEGLRFGSEIVLLEEDSEAVRFQPPGGAIGYGNVSIALALARASLSVQGIAQPTMRELADTLAGRGSQTDGNTPPVEGVLVLRAAGLRWGDVAQALGFSLGDAVIVANEEDSDLRIALAAQHAHRSVEIIERSIEAQPAHSASGATRDERSSR